MSYYRGNIFSTIMNAIFAVLIIYLLIQGLILLVPIGIIAWVIFRVYRYFSTIGQHKRESNDEPLVTKINIEDETIDSKVVDVEYEEVDK